LLLANGIATARDANLLHDLAPAGFGLDEVLQALTEGFLAARPFLQLLYFRRETERRVRVVCRRLARRFRRCGNHLPRRLRNLERRPD
jgi:hypothetical protein